MAKENDKPIAKITPSRNNSPGLRGSLKRVLFSHFKGQNKHVRVKNANQEGVIMVYGDSITRTDLEAFRESAKVNFEIEYFERQRTTKVEPKENNSERITQLQEQIHGLIGSKTDLEHKVAHLVGEKEEMTRTIGEQSAEIRKWDKDAGKIMQDNEALEIKNLNLSGDVTRLNTELSASNQRRATLSATLTDLDQEASQLRRASKPASSFYELAINHLAQYADKIPKIEALLGEHATDLDRPKLENIMEAVQKLGVRSGNITQAKEKIREYLRDTNATTNLEDFYRDQNKVAFDAYEDAIKSINEKQDQLEGAKKLNLSEKAFAALKSELEKETEKPEKIRDDYENKRSEFITKEQALLAELDRAIEKHQEYDEIATKIEALGATKLPIYINLHQDVEAYYLKIVFPLKEAQATQFRDMILLENIFTEEVINLLDDETVKSIQMRPTDFDLISYTLPLIKPLNNRKGYTLEKVLEIEQAMKRALQQGYSRTPLHNLGIEIDVIYNNHIDTPYAGSTIDDFATTTEGRRQRRDALDEYLRGVVGVPVEFSEICEKVQGKLSFPIKSFHLYADLKKLKENGVITREGLSRESKYIYKKPGSTIDDFAITTEGRTQRRDALNEYLRGVVGVPVALSEICEKVQGKLSFPIKSFHVSGDLKKLKENGVVTREGLSRESKYIYQKPEDQDNG